MPEVIYGGPLTIGLVRSKLEEHKIREAPLEVIETGKRVDAGPFGIEMIHMTHSIPDSRAVAIRTPLGTVLVTGDYKFDQTPVGGRAADVSRLAELGSEGVLCLCGDSTNADRAGIAPSESDVGPALLEAFSRCDGRIIVTCFASNVHRVQQVDRRRGAARPQGGAGRPLDAQELQHRLEPRDRLGARRHADPAEGDLGLSRRADRRDLDRQPGRAAVGSAAHGARRPHRRRASLRRHA